MKIVFVSYGPNFCVTQELTVKTLIGADNPGNEVYYLRTMRGGLVFPAIKKVHPLKWHQRLGHPSHDSLASLSMLCDVKLYKELKTFSTIVMHAIGKNKRQIAFL